MFKHYLGLIENVAVWPLISFAIFFGFFLSLLFWVFTADKKKIHEQSLMPLENDNTSPTLNSKEKWKK